MFYKQSFREFQYSFPQPQVYPKPTIKGLDISQRSHLEMAYLFRNGFCLVGQLC